MRKPTKKPRRQGRGRKRHGRGRKTRAPHLVPQQVERFSELNLEAAPALPGLDEAKIVLVEPPFWPRFTEHVAVHLLCALLIAGGAFWAGQVLAPPPPIIVPVTIDE